VGGLQGTDSVTGLVEIYNNPNVGTGKTLSVSAYTINDGNSGNNYTVTLFTDTTGVITAAPVPPQPPFDPSAVIPPGEEPIYRPPDFEPPPLSPIMIGGPAFPIFTIEGPVIMPVGIVPFGGGLLLIPRRTLGDFGEITGAAEFRKTPALEDFGEITGSAQFRRTMTLEDFGEITGAAEFRRTMTLEDFGEITGVAEFRTALTPGDFGEITGEAFLGGESGPDSEQ
jgi:hypothetical protein